MPGALPLYRLNDADGSDLRAAAHATCPGHAAYLTTGGYPDYQPVARYACTDWPANGHQVPAWELRLTQPATADDEDAHEAKRAERRRVIESNRAWRPATTVRREWLATFAARKTAPKGTAAMLGYVVTHQHHDLATAASSGHEMARTLLGVTGDPYAGRQTISDVIDAAPVGRQNVIILTPRAGRHRGRHHRPDLAAPRRARRPLPRHARVLGLPPGSHRVGSRTHRRH